MTITWQDVATTGILVAAVGYLARRTVRLIRRRGMQSCAGSCCTPCASRPAEKPLVTIEPPSER